MPWINNDCRGCKRCLRVCMFSAIKFENNKAIIDQKECVLCGHCLNSVCPFEAIRKDDEM